MCFNTKKTLAVPLAKVLIAFAQKKREIILLLILLVVL